LASPHERRAEMSELLREKSDLKSNIVVFPLGSIAVRNLSGDTPKSTNVPTPTFEKLVQASWDLDRISGYKSKFNFEVYRSLEKRFLGKEIRGGLICKTDLKLVNFHPSCFKCHCTLELDTYGRGCIHECAYCYAKDELSLHGYWNNPIPFPIDVNSIRKIFYTVFETDRKSKWREILEKRIPIRMGSMSDSFMWSELKYGVTYEILNILNYYRYPRLIFTRSDLVAHDKYLSIHEKELTSIQFSICGDNKELTKQMEPGAPSVSRRLQAIRKLADEGHWVAVRINPLFPKYPDGYFSEPDKVRERFGSLESCPKFNLLDIDRADEFMFDLASAGAKTVLTGFVRLKASSLNNLKRTAGIDLKPMFRPEVITPGLRGNREKKYSDAEIKVYYQKLAAAAQRQGLRFSTCYIGNGAKDYYQYQSLWANKTDCCDVIGNVAAFKTSSQTIPWEVRAKHTLNKSLVEHSRAEEACLDREYSQSDKPHKDTTDDLDASV